MKKILLSLFVLTLIGSIQLLEAQTTVCTPGTIKRWTGTGAPGDSAVGQAGHTGTELFIIDGNNADWTQHITGPLNPAYLVASPPNYRPDPYLSPVSPGNVQLDGLKDSASSSSNYDRDRPGQTHRDLRYFAFTYDRANIYFLFRRPGNNNSQVSFYYFIDIDVDGFMKTGEPVARVTYNGGTATLTMYYYIENTGSNATAAGSWVSGKGNSMVATVARAGTSSVSQWVIGKADGWSMPGSIAAAPLTQLPALGTVGSVSEVFSAMAMNVAGAVGYGAEFAIPWKYLRYYSAGTSYSGPTPQKILDFNKIFTWHESLDNGTGNNNSYDDEDNAGGCCLGLAASGNPVIRVVPPSSLVPDSTHGSNTKYTSKVKYIDSASASTTIFLDRVEFSNIVINSPYTVDTTDFDVKVYKDANNDGIPDDAGVTYSYNLSLSTPPTIYVYTAVTSNSLTIPADSMRSFITKVDMKMIGVKSFTLTTSTNNEIISTGNADCGGQNTTTTTQDSKTITTTLPVAISSFTATRNLSSVLLKWETDWEQNNSGFAIERNIDGNWQQIGFVPSQANGGNSSDLLRYQFIDNNNNAKGITQYRLRQVDFDNKSKFSEIRTVRGEAQIGKIIVYPNPTLDGKVNVSFEDANVIRDVSLIDMSGRLIKQWKAVTNNQLTIGNLTPGMYTLRVVLPETGVQIVEKIVVNKR